MFTSSKPWLTGVNFAPRTKNWQCTAITTMQIKQKQAQFTPDQNSTNTICNPNDGRKFAIQLSKTNWTSTKFQKLLDKRGEFSTTIKNTDNLYKPQILTTAWIKRESITEGKICNRNEQEKLNEHYIPETAWTRSEFSITIKNTDNLHKPEILTTWMNWERMFHYCQ